VGKLPTHPAELPLRQLAHALVLARRDAGWSSRDVARRLGVHLADLRAWEHGRARPGWEELDGLSELYGEHLVERLREREPVVLDRAAGVLRIGDRVAAFDPDSTDNDAVLRLYLRRVRELRGLRRGATFPLRDDDVAALALVIDVHDAALEDRLIALMGVGRTEAGALRRRLVAAAAVAVVGTGAVGVAFARFDGAGTQPPVVAGAAVASTAGASIDRAESGSPDDVAPAIVAPAPSSASPTTTPSTSARDTSTPAPEAAAPEAAAPVTIEPAPAAPAASTTSTVAEPSASTTVDTTAEATTPSVPDAADTDVLASTTPPEPVVIEDPVEAFVEPPVTTTDDGPPAPLSHDDPAEAFTS
jgi:transcriptional regulator with XRE-family HTH domain